MVSPSSTSGALLALLAVTLFSTSALLVRLSAPVPSLEVAFWRLLVAGVVVLLAARLTGQLSRRPTFDARRFGVYGLITAAHFGLYIASLGYTTVANALAIVYTAPVFVAAFSHAFLREPVTRRQLAGIAVVVLGVSILAGYDIATDARRLAGDALALGSAAAFGLYSVAGRGERARYPLLVYAGAVYLLASLWLLPAAGFSFDVARYTPANSAAIAALAVFPLAVGHTLYNAALRRIHATRANVLSTLEVVGGAFLAWAVLGEPVPPEAALGTAVTLAGVLAVIL